MTILKMDPAEYSVSAEYLSLMLDVLARRGVDTEQVLAGTNIESGCWRDPKARITAQDFERVALRAVNITARALARLGAWCVNDALFPWFSGVCGDEQCHPR